MPKRTTLAGIALFLILAGCGGGDGNLRSGSDSTPVFGPTALYSFDETSGTTAANSGGFSGYDGQIVGAAHVAGISGEALDFTATSTAHVLIDICCNSDPDTGEGDLSIHFSNNSFTVAAWLKPLNMQSDRIYPVFGDVYGAVQSMKLRINNGVAELLLYPPNNGEAVSLVLGNTVLQNDEWTHVAVVYDGTIATLYINGEVDNTANLSMSVQTMINDIYIGGIPSEYSAGPGEHAFPGIIDEFVLSQESFSQAQVQELTAAGTS